MIKGGCACGGIRFEIDAVRSMTHCHCTTCRKLTGASFATFAHVEKDKFRWLAGEELISRYESSSGQFPRLLPDLRLAGAWPSALPRDGERAGGPARG